ncbi:MAG: anaerobic ribonucleoside-triphosphate reductase activating protein [Syntrophobacterales bacterium]|nr:anaerobic ribonucleoside-triphosphate reductase activating protein [Syntrophobacterales bacterium]
MKIAGFQKFSLIDYPGGVSGVVFTQGCNFRCPYCHNPELVDPRRFVGSIPAEDILGFLEDRRGKLDAVTITGGEPTLQGDLPVFIKEIKDMGFLVKIDTNGSMPTMLARLLAGGLVDYVAMDLKGPLERYPTLVGAAVNRRDLEESIALLGDAGLPHEFRTTLVASLLTVEEIVSLVERIPAAPRYVLQRFVPSKLLDPRLGENDCFSEEEIAGLKVLLEKRLPCVVVR